MRAIGFGLAVMMVGGGAARAGQTWFRAELPQVTVYTDASQKELADFTTKYAAFYAAFNAVVAPPGQRCPPSTVVLFKRLTTLQSYGTPNAAIHADDLVSLESHFDGNSVTALALDRDPDEALVTLYESNGSWMLQEVGLFLPLSVRQGTAEYFSTFELKGDAAVVGERDRRYENPNGPSGDMEWPKFFSITTNSPEYGLYGHKTDGIYFSQSWELMHAVLSAPDVEQSRARFRHLVDLLYAKEDEMQAFAAFFETTPHHLGMAVENAPFNHTLRLPFDRAAAQRAMKIEPAPDADVRAQLFELLVSEDRLRAEVTLNQAERLSPHSPVVELSQAHWALMNGDSLEAINHFRSALADGAQDANAYFYSGKGRLDDDIGEGRLVVGKGGDGTLQAIKELRQCLALQPSSGRAYLQLARAYLAAPSVKPGMFSDLDPGLLNQGVAGQLRFFIGVLDRRVRDRAGAQRQFQQLVDDPHVSTGIRQQAQAQLEAMAEAAKPKPPPAVAPPASEEAHPTEHHAPPPELPYLLQDVTFRVGSEQWGGFRDYLSAMAQKVENQLQVPADPKAVPFHGQIAVPIALSSDGTATESADPQAPAGTSPALLAACRQAVKQAGPFEAWEPDMSSLLGEQQHLVVLFNFL